MACSAAVSGVIDTIAPGNRVTVAAAHFVGSAALVAVTVALIPEVIEDGAVYRPDDETVPAEAVQITLLLPHPVRIAVNCCVSAAFTVAVSGSTVIVTFLIAGGRSS